jgi:GT2 family glycosyltransferase
MIDVSIVVVAHNDEADLPLSLASAAGQTGARVETIVVDNASSDRSREVAAAFAPAVRIVPLAENVGFAAGMNRGIEESAGRYVLALNPDCRLMPDFASVLAARLDVRTDAGSASGRVYRANGPELLKTDRLDSTGLYFTASGRHFDRDSGRPETGRSLLEEEIFGVSGAAGFYRREALESARISTGCFDADFFLYREDADLAWRLQRLGWTCLYVPRAVAYHRRRNLPERRRIMSAAANMHSVKNRFLLRINNETPGHFVATCVPALARDAVVLAACLTVERSSLPAFGWLWKNRKRLWAKRREIRERVQSRKSKVQRGQADG